MCSTIVCFVIFFLSFNFIWTSQVSTKSENTTSRSIDFVEIVKKDLRRNNEDYIEMIDDNKLTSATKGYHDINKKSRIISKVKYNEFLRPNRRTNVDSTEYSYDDKGKSTTKQLVTSNATTLVIPINELLRSQTDKKMVKEKILKRLSKMDIMKTIVPYTLTTVNNATRLQIKDGKIPKFVNKNKIEKFQKFMAKNKGLLKDFLSSKMEIQTQKTIQNNSLRNNDLVDLLKHQVKLKYAQKYQTSEKAPLNPDMLDMSPARGGRIHRLRVKGRLCQRHVLMPEGPKYDTLGKWYLPAHKLVVNHPYNLTRPPKMLLPRCCNCCKKSVLGCE